MELAAEGSLNDFKAVGIAMDCLKTEAIQMAQTLAASGGGNCPCTTCKCPCKCSQPGGDGAKGPDPWGGFKPTTGGTTKFANLTPPAAGAASTPFGVGAGLGAQSDDRKARWGGGGPNLTQAPPGLKSDEITKLTVNSKLFDEKTAREKLVPRSARA